MKAICIRERLGIKVGDIVNVRQFDLITGNLGKQYVVQKENEIGLISLTEKDYKFHFKGLQELREKKINEILS